MLIHYICIMTLLISTSLSFQLNNPINMGLSIRRNHFTDTITSPTQSFRNCPEQQQQRPKYSQHSHLYEKKKVRDDTDTIQIRQRDTAFKLRLMPVPNNLRPPPSPSTPTPPPILQNPVQEFRRDVILLHRARPRRFLRSLVWSLSVNVL